MTLHRPMVVGVGARLSPDTGPDVARDWSNRKQST
jgi:hypothetical protein